MHRGLTKAIAAAVCLLVMSCASTEGSRPDGPEGRERFTEGDGGPNDRSEPDRRGDLSPLPIAPTKRPKASGQKLPVAAPPVRRAAPILVGVPHLDYEQQAAVAKSAGLKEGAPDDAKTYYALLIDDLNKRGGILGRQIRPIFHKYNLTGNRASEEQSACAAFTEDHHAQFIFSSSVTTTGLRCFLRDGAGVLDTSWSVLNESDYAQLPGFLQPATIALDRLARIEAERFTTMRFFTPTPARVGILYYDEPHFKRAAQVLAAELGERGINVVEEQPVHLANSVDEAGQTASEAQSATLRFRQARVTHVLTVEVDWFITGFFAVAASSQGYYPRYGLTSNHQLTNLRDEVPAQALQKARFVGWYPAMDVEDKRWYPAQTKSCLEFLQRKGEPMVTGQQRKGAVQACESVRYLEASLTAGKGLTRNALVTGARQLRSTYTPTATFSTAITSTRSAGAAVIRDGDFNGSCACFVYAGTPIPVD